MFGIGLIEILILAGLGLIVAIVILVNALGSSSGNLIACPACHRGISPFAPACPHCGHPIAPPPR